MDEVVKSKIVSPSLTKVNDHFSGTGKSVSDGKTSSQSVMSQPFDVFLQNIDERKLKQQKKQESKSSKSKKKK